MGQKTINSGPVLKDKLAFFLASAIGMSFLIFPVHNGEYITIPMGILTDALTAFIGDIVKYVALALCMASALLTTYFQWFDRAPRSDLIVRLFRPGHSWTLIRILGAVFCVSLVYHIGPEWIWGESTGGVVVNDLFPPMLVTIGIACCVLPFLTEFGLMEFIGTYCERYFKRLFKIPGRSAVDAVASWLGGSAVGVVVTSNQYEQGHYTAREAAIIASNFSIVSIAFCYVITDVLNIQQYFFSFYAVLTLSGILCAMILPRIPPLSTKSNEYLTQLSHPDRDDAHLSVHNRALQRAYVRAKSAPGPTNIARSIGINISDIWLGMVPACAFMATAFLAMAEYTDFFKTIAIPVMALLSLLQVESADVAGVSVVIGFADNFLPALIAADIESEATRFVIAVVSVGQLIFLSEVGILLLQSAIPLKILDLLLIYILRTIVILPVAIIAANLLF
ncbi:YjiH family protein [Alteromonas sediminis]|uniref:YjiH family protein n=1 Tax=Alteromonas sediminis TaxID=2259342 RepID=A0A3N5YAI3_9ALTE|nr:nucleoside recognition domain-containing protein [Alteromonas sediminis]RPJ68569.1 YjiH family protein [Alteromonas sediminis]